MNALQEIDERVKEIMEENRMNINDKILVINCSIIYTIAQKDLLKKQVSQR